MAAVAKINAPRQARGDAESAICEATEVTAEPANGQPQQQRKHQEVATAAVIPRRFLVSSTPTKPPRRSPTMVLLVKYQSPPPGGCSSNAGCSSRPSRREPGSALAAAPMKINCRPWSLMRSGVQARKYEVEAVAQHLTQQVYGQAEVAPGQRAWGESIV